MIADSSSPPQTQIDLTPVKLPERSRAFGDFQSFKMGMLYKLPARMFFNTTCENSLRLETNVLQTHNRNHADMIYRVLPNVTLGYALTKQTRVSANYFFFRDQYMDNSNFLSRNVHSVGMQGNHDFIISPRTTITTGVLWRELFITRNPDLNDLIPQAQVVRRVGERGAIYGGVMGQFRFQHVFGVFQEADQFYSFGAVYRTPKWTLLADNTLITNFGKRHLRGGDNNQVIVMTLEAGRKISSRLPLTAFVRAEPIFNMGDWKRTGFGGVNVRIFGGIRAEINKPAIFPVHIKSAS